MKTSLAMLLLLGSVAHADPAPDHDRFVRRTIAVVVGSIGAASIIVGGLHAIGSIEDRHQADGLCDPTCNSEGSFLANRAHGLARGAEILIGSGLAVVGIGVALWATAPEVRIVPVVAPTGAAAMLQLRF